MTMPRQAYLPLLQQGADLLDGASEVGEPTNKNYEQATQIEEPNQQEGLIWDDTSLYSLVKPAKRVKKDPILYPCVG